MPQRTGTSGTKLRPPQRPTDATTPRRGHQQAIAVFCGPPVLGATEEDSVTTSASCRSTVCLGGQTGRGRKACRESGHVARQESLVGYAASYGASTGIDLGSWREFGSPRCAHESRGCSGASRGASLLPCCGAGCPFPDRDFRFGHVHACSERVLVVLLEVAVDVQQCDVLGCVRPEHLHDCGISGWQRVPHDNESVCAFESLSGGVPVLAHDLVIEQRDLREARRDDVRHEVGKATRKLVAENPVRPDLMADYETAQAWPFVTAAYNGIEQALKMVLLVPSDSENTLEQLASRDYGHDLVKLYSKLPAADREHIELHFGEHWSLHEYDTGDLEIGSAEAFIAHINNGTTQNGLISWRYSLLDPTVQIPQTSIWTMCEIWHAICCLINARMLDVQGGCVRLSQRLEVGLQDLIPVLAPYDGYSDDLRHWMAHRKGTPLCAWLDLLDKVSRGAIGEVQAPARLRPELAQMADRAIEAMSHESADPDH